MRGLAEDALMPIKSATGERFWQIGLAQPVYHAGPGSSAKMLTPSGYWMIDRAGHPWDSVDFARGLLSLPIDYVEQHGTRCGAYSDAA